MSPQPSIDTILPTPSPLSKRALTFIVCKTFEGPNAIPSLSSSSLLMLGSIFIRLILACQVARKPTFLILITSILFIFGISYAYMLRTTPTLSKSSTPSRQSSPSSAQLSFSLVYSLENDTSLILFNL